MNGLGLNLLGRFASSCKIATLTWSYSLTVSVLISYFASVGKYGLIRQRVDVNITQKVCFRVPLRRIVMWFSIFKIKQFKNLCCQHYFCLKYSYLSRGSDLLGCLGV